MDTKVATDNLFEACRFKTCFRPNTIKEIPSPKSRASKTVNATKKGNWPFSGKGRLLEGGRISGTRIIVGIATKRVRKIVLSFRFKLVIKFLTNIYIILS